MFSSSTACFLLINGFSV